MDALGGNVGVAGMIVNKDDGTGEAAAFAKAVDIPVLTAIPADEDIRRKSANYQIIGKPGGEWGGLFEQLATNVAKAPPRQPAPLDQDGLLGLFSPEDTGGDIELHRNAGMRKDMSEIACSYTEIGLGNGAYGNHDQ